MNNAKATSRGQRPAQRAFTLIELLIVVLIIAILAAIAVPNFLEFQTRAKISRVHSDMRTLATAIEAYTVDNNRCPLGYWEYHNVHNINDSEMRYLAYSQLTTPIAYMSTWLSDPFGKYVKRADGTETDEMKYYHYETYWDDVLPNRNQVYNEARAKGYYWSLYSTGPQAMELPPWLPWMLARPAQYDALGNVYDPTNGTMSTGKIYRTNKGIVSGADFDQ